MHIHTILARAVLAGLFATPLLAIAAPSFSVFAGPGNRSGCGGNEGGSGAVPLAVSHVCADAIGTTSSNAAAGLGSLSTDSRTITLGGTSIPREDQARATFADTLVFTKTDPSLPDQFLASLNLSFSGMLNAASTSAGGAGAGVNLNVGFLGSSFLTAQVFGDGRFAVDNRFGDFGGTSTIAPGTAGFSTELVTSPKLASVGSVSFSLALGTEVFAFSVGSSATADFSHTLELPTGVDVFNLPTGYTVNAGTYLVDNRFIDATSAPAIPEPETWALLVAGLGCVGARLRRRGQ